MGSDIDAGYFQDTSSVGQMHLGRCKEEGKEEGKEEEQQEEQQEEEQQEEQQQEEQPSAQRRRKTMQANFQHYRLPLPDILLSNIHTSPLFSSGRASSTSRTSSTSAPPLLLLDAILCDVPYGFRKPRFSTTSDGKNGQYDDKGQTSDDLHASVLEYVLPLYALAAERLAVGGRLVFFFPTFRQQTWTELTLEHLFPNLQLLRQYEDVLKLVCEKNVITYFCCDIFYLHSIHLD